MPGLKQSQKHIAAVVAVTFEIQFFFIIAPLRLRAFLLSAFFGTVMFAAIATTTASAVLIFSNDAPHNRCGNSNNNRP